jgi:hypothetical protein
MWGNLNILNKSSTQFLEVHVNINCSFDIKLFGDYM